MSDIDWKDSVRVATSAALPPYARVGNTITASAVGSLPSIDGVSLAVNDRVLLIHGATAADNGIYSVTNLGSGSAQFVLTRSADADASAEVTGGLRIGVAEGAVHGGRVLVSLTPDPITLNSTGLRFTVTSARAATTAALPAYTRGGNIITANAVGKLSAIDGVSLAVNDRVLFNHGAAAADNGIYSVTNLGSSTTKFVLTRATDADVNVEVTSGLRVGVTQGAVNGGRVLVLTTPDPITLNTTGLSFAPSITAWNLFPVSLTDSDSDATLSVAGGRYYVQGPSAPLSSYRTKTLSASGAIAGDVITIERSDRTFHSLQIVNGGPAGGVLGVSSGPFDVSSYRFDGANWSSDPIRPNTTSWPVYNVRDFGARGDEYLTGLDPASEATAIQACIDAAAARAQEGLHSGARIYFPPGNYITAGHPILLRRTPFTRPLWYEGAGWQLVTIQNDSVDQSGDAFRVETETECTERLTKLFIASGMDPVMAGATAALNLQTNGGNGHVFKNIGVTSGGYCFVWDLGLATSDLGETLGDGHRFGGLVENVYLSRQRPGPAVRLHKSSRAHFQTIRIDPANNYMGAFGIEVRRGSASLEGAIGGTGMIRAYEGSEIHVRRCTSNGAWGTPAWDFTRCYEVSVKQTANEGHGEWEAIYRFDQCTGVVCEQAALATPDRGYPWLTGLVAVSGTPTLTFAHVDANYLWLEVNSITRSTGSWHADQIGIGSRVKVPGSSANNPSTWYTVIEATHETLYVKEDVVAETLVGATGVLGTQYKTTNSLQPTLQFFASTKKLTRTAGVGQPGAGSWIVDGFQVGDVINGSWTTNPGTLSTPGITITAITDTDLTFGGATIVNEGPMTGRYVFRNRTAAGIVFRATDTFSATGTLGGGFSAQGDSQRYGIEVDSSSRNGRVELSGPLSGTDINIVEPLPSAPPQNVTGEYHGLTETKYHGRHRMAGLEINEDLIHLRKGQAANPSSVAGISVKNGTGNGFGGLWYDYAAGAWKASYSSEVDETTLTQPLDFWAKRFVGGSSGTELVAQYGQGLRMYTTSSSLPTAPLGDALLWAFYQSGGPVIQSFGNTNWISSGSVSIQSTASSVDLTPGGVVAVLATSTGVTLGGNFVEVNGQLSSAVQVDSDAATVTFNFNQGNVHQVTLAGNRTLAFSNLRSGATCVLFLIQDGTGNRTVTWPGSAKFGGPGTPVLSTAAGKRDLLVGTSDGTNVYFHTVTKGF